MTVETCQRGHPWTPENTRIVPRKFGEARLCRTCDVERRRDRTRQQTPETAPAPPTPVPPRTPLPTAMRIPAACPREHELLARTTHISRTSGEDRWECVRCLREDCFRAYYRLPRTTPVPAEVLDETNFDRQPRSGSAAIWQSIEFASGWGFGDPDPTSQLRAEREAARQADQDELEAADAARIARELDEIEMTDARARRERRAQDANAATAAIRAAMSAARGGVAV